MNFLMPARIPKSHETETTWYGGLGSLRYCPTALGTQRISSQGEGLAVRPKGACTRQTATNQYKTHSTPLQAEDMFLYDVV